MTTPTAALNLLVALSLALAACATPAPTPTTSTPVLLHDMAIANPPYPRPLYANILDEPTRFEFRPRHLILQTPDNAPDEPAEPVANDGSYLENGILYVDPNQ
jgi:hypothetical protein